MDKGKLFLVATPIGNLDEISKRQLDVFNSVDFIACENPNNSIVLLKSININKKLLQINAIHEEEMSQKVINFLLEGKNIAYISDAGYPCISDPGYVLVNLAIANDIKIEVINGSSAMLSGLIASGIDTSKFLFYGFLSSKPGTRKNELLALSTIKETLVLYESSHRIEETINDLKSIFNGRKICLARELTKLHEEYIRCVLSPEFTLSEDQKKGEFVIIIEGKKTSESSIDEKIIEKISLLVEGGLSTKSAIEYISKTENINKNSIYNFYHKKH